MKQYIYNKVLMMFSAVALLAMASCSDDDYLGGHYVTDGQGTQMNLTAQINAPSNPSLAWAEGDVIGVAASTGLYDASVRNREYVCQSDGFSFSNVDGYPIYVKGNTTIVGYYPFTGMDGAEQTITLNTLDQENLVDYLFARAENVTPQTGANVNLVFNYVLTRFNVTISAPAGEKIVGCRVMGLAQNAAVDPYTLEITPDVPEDLVISGSNIKSLSLKLIPQTISDTPEIPAQLVLIGQTRSYTIDLSGLNLIEGDVMYANVDVSDGIGTIEFIPNGAAWEDSGAGGDYSSN